jgi:hypothetical protein
MKRLALTGILLSLAVLLTRVFAYPTLNSFLTVYTDTNGETLTDLYSGRVITNTGATGSQTFDLPPAATGSHFVFSLSTNKAILVNPQSDDLIIGLTSGSLGGDAISSDTTIGSTVELVAIDSANWLPIRVIGTWTDVN